MILFLLLLTAAVPVYAYLDPGTGSMLLQVILGGVAAVGVAVKMFWHRIVAFFSPSKGSKAGNDAP
jgi:hypothetical protein